MRAAGQRGEAHVARLVDVHAERAQYAIVVVVVVVVRGGGGGGGGGGGRGGGGESNKRVVLDGVAQRPNVLGPLLERLGVVRAQIVDHGVLGAAGERSRVDDYLKAERPSRIRERERCLA